MLKFLLAITLLNFATLAVKASTYDMKDLAILGQEKNHLEFFAHMLDLRPQDRQAQWKTLVEEMAIGFTGKVLKNQHYSEENLQAIENLAKLPLLKNNEFFINHYSQIIVKYLGQCLKTPGHEKFCLKKLETLWKSLPGDQDLAFNLGNLIVEHNLNRDPWDFFKISAKSEMGHFYCQKPALQTILLKKIKEISQSTTSDAQKLSLFNQLAHSDCWAQLDQLLISYMSRPGHQWNMLAFEVLTLRNKLDSANSDLYNTQYFLGGPKRKSLFNSSWNSIKELGQDFSRREKVLKQLKKMDPLPGHLFSQFDMKKRKVLLKHLHQNIPEYLDFYALNCIQFYGGLKEFKNGNPTLDCAGLFKASKGEEWIQSHYQKQFFAIKNPL